MNWSAGLTFRGAWCAKRAPATNGGPRCRLLLKTLRNQTENIQANCLQALDASMRRGFGAPTNGVAPTFECFGQNVLAAMFAPSVQIEDRTSRPRFSRISTTRGGGFAASPGAFPWNPSPSSTQLPTCSTGPPNDRKPLTTKLTPPKKTVDSETALRSPQGGFRIRVTWKLEGKGAWFLLRHHLVFLRVCGFDFIDVRGGPPRSRTVPGCRASPEHPGTAGPRISIQIAFKYPHKGLCWSSGFSGLFDARSKFTGNPSHWAAWVDEGKNRYLATLARSSHGARVEGDVLARAQAGEAGAAELRASASTGT